LEEIRKHFISKHCSIIQTIEIHKNTKTGTGILITLGHYVHARESKVCVYPQVMSDTIDPL